MKESPDERLTKHIAQALKNGLTLQDLERIAMEVALENSQRNKSEAARMLGISRTQFYRKNGDFNLPIPN